MFKNLLFKIKYYRTIKEIVRISRNNWHKIAEMNGTQKLFETFESPNNSYDVTIILNNIKYSITDFYFTMEFNRKYNYKTIRFLRFEHSGFFKELEIFCPNVIKPIKCGLVDVLNILRKYETEILKIKAIEDAEILEDINKILLKR